MGRPESMAFSHLAVTIESIEASSVLVIDSFGVKRTLARQTRSGRLPMLGERWSIVQSMGRWTFDVLIRPAPSEVDWQPLAPVNGWVGIPEYRTHNGLVLLAGHLTHPSGVTGVAFVLPLAVRPGRALTLFGSIPVAVDGSVTLPGATHLDGLSFLAGA